MVSAGRLNLPGGVKELSSRPRSCSRKRSRPGVSLPCINDLHTKKNEMRNTFIEKLSWHDKQIYRETCVSFEKIRPAWFGRQQMRKSTQLLSQHSGLSDSLVSVQFSMSCRVGWNRHQLGGLDVSKEVVMGGEVRAGWEGRWFQGSLTYPLFF